MNIAGRVRISRNSDRAGHARQRRNRTAIRDILRCPRLGDDVARSLPVTSSMWANTCATPLSLTSVGLQAPGGSYRAGRIP